MPRCSSRSSSVIAEVRPAAIAEQLGPDSRAAFAVAVSEASGAERDHDWQHLSTPRNWESVLSSDDVVEPIRGNTEGTPPRALASTTGYSSSGVCFFLRGFRARGFPLVPAVPVSLLDGKEGDRRFESVRGL
jgi:hypothetical protein